MLSGFAIILDNEILYCSNDNKYTHFEIITFVQTLIDSMNRNQTWRLNNIIFKREVPGDESMLIKHVYTQNNQNIFFCIIGDFNAGSRISSELLEEFTTSIENYFVNKEITQLKTPFERAAFIEHIDYIILYLIDKYDNLINGNNNYEKHIGVSDYSKIIYAGISNQGLPIISKLYDHDLLQRIGKESNRENMELFCSDISAKLATIAMNTIIRTNSNIEEIQIQDINDDGLDKIILYANIHDFSVDFVASGNFSRIKEIFTKFHHQVSSEGIFHEGFNGDLKPYKYLQKFLDDLNNDFDNEK
ncbi:MAG: hypothetical protein ACFFBP_03575 [Promethearchaeota archaeon]